MLPSAKRSFLNCMWLIIINYLCPLLLGSLQPTPTISATHLGKHHVLHSATRTNPWSVANKNLLLISSVLVSPCSFMSSSSPQHHGTDAFPLLPTRRIVRFRHDGAVAFIYFPLILLLPSTLVLSQDGKELHE